MEESETSQNFDINVVSMMIFLRGCRVYSFTKCCWKCTISNENAYKDRKSHIIVQVNIVGKMHIGSMETKTSSLLLSFLTRFN